MKVVVLADTTEAERKMYAAFDLSRRRSCLRSVLMTTLSRLETSLIKFGDESA